MTQTQTQITLYDPQERIEHAIAQGILSDDPRSLLYAGRYIYLGTRDGLSVYKSIDDQRCVRVPS